MSSSIEKLKERAEQALKPGSGAIIEDIIAAGEQSGVAEDEDEEFLTSYLSKRPHLAAHLVNGKADASTDPSHGFSKSTFNLKAQGAFLLKNGEVAAQALAAAYGGGFGRKGTLDQPRGKKSSTNPWSTESWNTTEQGRVYLALGEVKAKSLARSAGSHIGATRPAKVAW